MKIEYEATFTDIDKTAVRAKRESWSLKDVEITIDEWPFLKTYSGDSKIVEDQPTFKNLTA